MIMNTSLLIAAALVEVRDGSGVFGGIFHYSLIFATMGSALLAFIYFWRKGQLALDEEPKMQMMREEDKEDSHGA